MVMAVMLLALAHSVQTTRPRIHNPPVLGSADTCNRHRHWRQNVVEVFKVSMAMDSELPSQVSCGEEEPVGAASARWSAACQPRKSLRSLSPIALALLWYLRRV